MIDSQTNVAEAPPVEFQVTRQLNGTSSETRFKRKVTIWTLVIAGATAAVPLYLGITGDDSSNGPEADGPQIVQGNGSQIVQGDGSQIVQGDGSQIVQGNNNQVEFAEPLRLNPATLNVVSAGPGMWALRIRNFKPGTMVTLSLSGPHGETLDLGSVSQRFVDDDGTADTADFHHFWEHASGEPVGTYTLTASGTDQTGGKETSIASFEVGEQVVAPTGS